jgi:5-methylcytosine-specific restriction endonuclease McrA
MICQVVKIKINRKDKMTKRLTLNAEKRKAIESVFQSHWIEHSKFNQGLQEAKEKYNQMRVKMLQLCSNIVRQHQPQEDVDTIRAMSNKYGSSGGELYHDNCFNFETDIINDEGQRDKDTVRVDFSLDDNHGFARAYYRDELIKANCDPDFQVRWNEDNKRNPKYYDEENKCDTWLGFRNYLLLLKKR